MFLFTNIPCLIYNKYSKLKEYNYVLNKIDNREDAQLDSHTSIDYIKEFIEIELKKLNLFETYDIQKGLSIKDVSTISLALYLKKYENRISKQLNDLMSILPSYNTNEAKYLLELIKMLKTAQLSTSITSTTIERSLMPYYAELLGIAYDELSTSNMYTFIMINTISEISTILPFFISSIHIEDINLKDVNGHLDCFNSHKDEINANYPIDDLASALTSFKVNLDSVVNKIKPKDANVCLQLDIHV